MLDEDKSIIVSAFLCSVTHTVITMLDFISRCPPYDSISSCWGNSIRIALGASLGLKVIFPLGLERCLRGICAWVTAVAELCYMPPAAFLPLILHLTNDPLLCLSSLSLLEWRRPYSHSTSPSILAAVDLSWLWGYSCPPKEVGQPRTRWLHRACAAGRGRPAGERAIPLARTSFRNPRRLTFCFRALTALGSAGAREGAGMGLTLEPAPFPPDASLPG